jgi:hypothetical protein
MAGIYNTFGENPFKETVEKFYNKYGYLSTNVIYSDVFPLINADLTIENYYIHLITEGGSENKGELNTYLQNPDIKLKKLIAYQDIAYSNSAIEAFNKIVKYQELHLKNIPDIDTLERTLSDWIPIFNNQRPNRKGKYLLTPSELYNSNTIDPLRIKKRLDQARIDRIRFNKIYSCGIC